MSNEKTDSVMAKLTSDENAPYLNSIMEKLPLLDSILDNIQEMNSNGTLQSLMGLLTVVGNMDKILDEQMISGLGSILNKILEIVEVANQSGTENLLKAVFEGIDKGYEQTDEVKGIMGISRKLKDPDIARGVQIAFSILKEIGKKN
ncbi:DUF1641 domain-containing protein [Cuniculiplasma sp. SKW3]|uniref:DUF1641 domain-containing protein n=1 Tax=Cuniculiplasma sp. SKW3 TaxID=3400170 RepID=UPI003FD54128